MDIQVEKLSVRDVEDFSKLIRIFEVVFEMNNLMIPDNNYLQHLLSKSDFITLVAKYNNKVVGGLTVYILHRYYSARPSAYIYDVGVLPDYQRKGIGKKLITYLTNYCRENDFEDAFVHAETQDQKAINFYKTTAFSHQLQATHFTYLTNKASTDKHK